MITMLAQAGITISNTVPVDRIGDTVKVIHEWLPSFSVEQITVVVLLVSKLAQIAYKHWTTPGTKLDTLMKTVGVVQEPITTTVITNTGTSSGNGPR